MNFKILTHNKSLWFVGFGLAALLIIIFTVAVLNIKAKSHQNFGPTPEFSNISDVSEMKIAFFNYLTPIIEHHNLLIQQERNQLILIQTQYNKDNKLKKKYRKMMVKIAKNYDFPLNKNWHKPVKQAPFNTSKNNNQTINSSKNNNQTIHQIIDQLLLRVDKIPLSLALVQAAKESGWGRSRFAVEANNLFGQWCYTQGCGLVPSKRAKGAKHEVAQFDNTSAAIASYMNNLNSHHRYTLLRSIRADLRSQGKPITGKALAKGLIYYSQRREAYIDDIIGMLKDYNQFASQAAALQTPTE